MAGEIKAAKVSAGLPAHRQPCAGYRDPEAGGAGYTAGADEDKTDRRTNRADCISTSNAPL